MKLRWWPQERTFVLTGRRRRIVVGFTGLDRPSIQWHLTLWWHRRMLLNRIWWSVWFDLALVVLIVTCLWLWSKGSL